MAKRQMLLIVGAVLVLVVGLAILLSRPKTIKVAPIAFRIANDGQPDSTLNIWGGRRFWVTNNTSKAVFVSITEIEIKDGSNWSARPLSPSSRFASQTLQFQPTQPGRSVRPYLGPHQASFADLGPSVPSISQPSGTIWRIRARASQELNGLPRVWAAIRNYIQRRRFGIPPGASANPFSITITYYGQPAEVVSEEIVEQ